MTRHVQPAVLSELDKRLEMSTVTWVATDFSITVARIVGDAIESGAVSAIDFLAVIGEKNLLTYIAGLREGRRSTGRALVAIAALQGKQIEVSLSTIPS